MQIQCIGIHYDHEQEYQRAWIYYVISSVAAIFTVLFSYTSHPFYMSLEAVCATVSNVIHMIITVMIPTSFTILLFNIHTRFVLLNLLLRFTFYLIFE